MKLFGYEEGKDQQARLMELSEVSILTDSAELRAVARVLEQLAAEMESDNFDHVHLEDRLKCLSDGPHLVVVKAT
ncbi:hypothetical protein [Dyella sp. 2HG41-7]|uniref:Imm32 family immunity protein n=1 Tax=Dyella sp. 2HG41-7 TaxID=2883239 RepID=UPI001F45B525|nr:hypothetical protein [Dyella sp. 2HG41-7]